MRFTNRRDFLKIAPTAYALHVLSPMAGWAKQDVKGASSTEVSDKEYMKKFHEFYCQNYFNFDKHMSAQEKEFIKHRLMEPDSWWVQVSPSVELSTITYSQRIQGAKVNSSRIGCGSLLPKDTSQKMAREICKTRGIKLAELKDQGSPLGLAWDFEEDLFKVYFFESNLKQQPDPSLKTLLSQVANYELQTFGIRSYSFKGGKIVERKIYAPLKAVDKMEQIAKDKSLLAMKNKIQHINLMVTDHRGVVPQYDVKFGEALDNNVFNAQGQKIIAELDRKLALKMDTLSYNNKDEFTFYYP